MGEPLGDFENYSALFRAMATAGEHFDYHQALADIGGSRQRKHVPHEEIDPLTGEKKGSAAQRAAQMLQWLLANDPDYARAYRAVLHVADRTAGLLECVLTDLEDARILLDELLSRAARLPDGRRVFRDADGNVVDKNGQPVSDVLAATIEWTGNEPTYEEFRAARDRVSTLATAVTELQGIEAEIGGLQNDLSDLDPPPSAERSKEIEMEATRLSDRLEAIQQELDRNVERNQGFSADNTGIAPIARSNQPLPEISISR